MQTDSAQFLRFEEHIVSGGSVDATDWMPDEYREVVLKTVGFQAAAEVAGSLAFAEFLPDAPSLNAKLIMAAKIQDEIGHAHVLMRVCEDLGKSREDIMADFESGRIKLLAYFQFRPEDWHHFAVDCLLGTPAAILQFQSLSRGSYLPYNRALRKILKEESFHFHRALDLTKALYRKGNNAQRDAMQEALGLWWNRTSGYFMGPPDTGKPQTPSQKWRIKVDTNDQIRQRWFDRVVPIFTELGFTIPDPAMRRDPDTGQWLYTAPDWDEFRQASKVGTPYGQWLKERTMEEFYRFASVREAFQVNEGRATRPAAVVDVESDEQIPMTGH